MIENNKNNNEIRITHLEDGDYVVKIEGTILIKSDFETCIMFLEDYLKE